MRYFFARMRNQRVGFCTALVSSAGYCFVEVVIGHLQIVLVSDWSRIAKPLTHNVQGESGCQFRLPARSQVVKQLGPGLYASTFNDPQELGSQIRVAIVVTRDDVFRSSVSLVKH